MTDNTKYEVTRDEALSFCETAMRNWQYVAFSEDELDDLRVGLERFLSARLTSQPAPGDLVSVPREPTDAMYEAAAIAWEGALSTYWAMKMWHAMIDAAPAAQPDRERVLREAAQAVLSWWPEGSETNSHAARQKPDGFAQDIQRLRALLAQAPQQSDTQSDAVRDFDPHDLHSDWFGVRCEQCRAYGPVMEESDLCAKCHEFIRNEAADTGGRP